MRMVRPYGTSRTKPGEGGLHRVLVDKSPQRAEHDITEFARSHDELVIAQWISVIDKIARKPAGGKRPSAAQRSFRHKLGNVCWLRLMEGGHLRAGGSKRVFLSDLWWFKIHPYGAGDEEPRSRRDGSMPPPPKVQGRWYRVFVGESAPETVGPPTLAEIAARIESHLYFAERRLGENVPPGSRGMIAARAESIRASVLGPTKTGAKIGPSATDVDAYKKTGDPALAIYNSARGLEEKGRRLGLPVAAKILFEHWGRVFRHSQSGQPMTVTDAQAALPGLFALHSMLRNTYSKLLKRNRKDTEEQRKRAPAGRKLSELLPRNVEEAVKLGERQADNAELAGLVRLGKIIHYSASGAGMDETRALSTGWPSQIDDSFFWTSDGQSEIKRSEAFVRIWRHGLVFCGVTLRDWVSMKVSFEGDILGGNPAMLNDALAFDKFERSHFDGKLFSLFGNRVASFRILTDSDRLGVLRGLIEAAASLRHAIFHFKGRGQFLDDLTNLPLSLSPTVVGAANRVWSDDQYQRTGQLKAVLRAAHVEFFFDPDQLTLAFEMLSCHGASGLPLPRFARVLQRAEDAWDHSGRSNLPSPANRRALEDPARLCQYTVIKLVYERPFRSWLQGRSASSISGWIDEAVERATEAAKRINTRGDETAKKIIAARAAELPKPPAGGDIIDFFFDLSAATASEMRVQRGYESDADRAREQAEYIDHLLCDVILLAFNAFLSEHEFGWLLDLQPGQPMPEQMKSRLDDVRSEIPQADAEAWQAVLYLLLHLAPVDSVGHLLHQLTKWNVTAKRETALPRHETDRLERLVSAMTLYLDMHDAKFDGDGSFDQHARFQELFDTVAARDRILPREPGRQLHQQIPKRGLREVLRFGHVGLLKRLVGDRKIGDTAIERVFAAEQPQNGGPSPIAALHRQREDLHERWVKNRHLEETDLRSYCEVLSKIASHRHESNFVTLVDHVRAHRMVISVLGRLVDYSGLFERDLYFATLALLWRRGLRPEQLLKEAGLRFLFNGQILFALRRHKTSPDATALMTELARHFSEAWIPGNPNGQTRNNLAHLNMLQGSSPDPRLTYWVNQARQLMAYDRKLKNAVSKSMIELMAREGLELRWTMNLEADAHQLAEPELSSRSAKHLGGKRLTLAEPGPRPRTVLVEETLHGDVCVAMVAAAFEGRWHKAMSVQDSLPRVNWTVSAEQRRASPNASQPRPQRPLSTEKRPRR